MARKHDNGRRYLGNGSRAALFDVGRHLAIRRGGILGAPFSRKPIALTHAETIFSTSNSPFEFTAGACAAASPR